VAAPPEPLTQPARNVPERLSVALQAAWEDLSECTHEISRASAAVQAAPSAAPSLIAIRDWYQETTRVLLAEPVKKFMRLQPIRRTLGAMRACDQESPAAAVHARKRTDADFQRLLAVTALDLCEPWRIWRGANHPAEWRAWQRRREQHDKQASTLLNRYTRWAQETGSANATGHAGTTTSGNDAWWRQERAVTATLDAEVALRDLTLAWFDGVHAFANDVQRERENLRSYTTATLTWLQQGPESGVVASESLGLITPEERLRGWAVPVESEALRRLPERVELLAAGRTGLRAHTIATHASFLKTFDTYARTPMRAIVERSWQQGAVSLRGVEQAKEMIAYWSEASSSPAGEASALMADARHNAIAALTEQLQAPAQTEQLDAELVDAFWTWHKKGSIAVEANFYGWLTLLERPHGWAFLDTLFDAARLKAKAALHNGGLWATERVDRMMESIGGRVPPHPTLPPVFRRTTLRDTLSLPTTKSDLPALYRLLFRLAPVEDRRFLVGRNQELAGLEQALGDWTMGRFAACLLIGARGSGKSSLLSCAVRDIFADQPWIRGEFHERILTPAKLDAFLRKLLNLSEDADLEAAFRAERRVLILEEAERIYLRKVGGFAAAHYLTDLIHRTASTTLWIIVMNDRSFRVLDAGTHLHQVFSHRINAMNVSRVDLENAILERHRLSGLRLEFAPPEVSDPRVNRVKRWLGLEESSQKLFFDSLFQQSEGIFRSAFQLWLSSIERVEGETLKIRQPLDPAFSRFRGELAQQDKFTLLVIQEHGSLTPNEAAEVLCEKRDHSSIRMERLTALGLIEPDPEHPGLRVNPEAQRFVNDLLRRTNLT
jgi:AAA ATPase domain